MEELKEEIAEYLHNIVEGISTAEDPYIPHDEAISDAEYILRLCKEHNYVRLDEDQTILMPCYEDGDETKCTYIKAQPPSWITEANFKKVKSD